MHALEKSSTLWGSKKNKKVRMITQQPDSSGNEMIQERFDIERNLMCSFKLKWVLLLPSLLDQAIACKGCMDLGTLGIVGDPLK